MGNSSTRGGPWEHATVSNDPALLPSEAGDRIRSLANLGQSQWQGNGARTLEGHRWG